MFVLDVQIPATCITLDQLVELRMDDMRGPVSQGARMGYQALIARVHNILASSQG